MKKFLGILLSLTLLAGATAAMAEFDYAQDITVVSREEGSGTRGAFIELLGVEKEDEAEMCIRDSVCHLERGRRAGVVKQ